MKIKHFLLGSLLSLLSMTTVAQNMSNLGIDFLALGEYQLAQDYFMRTLRQTPADAYYYLGEIAYRQGKFDEAKAYYENAVKANPESLGVVGLIKLTLKNNPKEGIKQLNEYQKKHKKNVVVILEIARAYYENGMVEEGAKKLAEARKIDKKSPLPFVFQGDLFAKDKKTSEALGQYQQAIYFGPNYPLAYMKAALVYDNVNFNRAIETLKKVVEIDPQYVIAYKYLGQLYRLNSFYPNAIASYKIYFESNYSTIEDLINYAAANYFGGELDEAKALILTGLEKEPSNFVLNRLLMYTENDQKEYEKAYLTAQTFFSLNTSDAAKFLTRDYMTYANILYQIGMKKEVINAYENALKVADKKNTETYFELYTEIASLCSKQEQYTNAIHFYKEYMSVKGESVDALDFFQLGRYLYIGGSALSKDSLEAVKLEGIAMLLEADTTFAMVAEMIPEIHIGTFWRARTNAALDPDTKGLAKPYYEATIAKLLESGDPKNNKDLLEAYSYMAYYYYVEFFNNKKETDKAFIKQYSEKILEIDPSNKTGKTLLEFVNQ